MCQIAAVGRGFTASNKASRLWSSFTTQVHHLFQVAASFYCFIWMNNVNKDICLSVCYLTVQVQNVWRFLFLCLRRLLAVLININKKALHPYLQLILLNPDSDYQETAMDLFFFYHLQMSAEE